MRLTEYQATEGGIPYVVVKDEQDALQKLAAYEDTGLEPEAVDNLRLSLCGAVAAEIAEEQGYVEVNRAEEIAHAEAEGRLVILPCKVGDVVYYIDDGKSYKAKAITFRVNKSGIRVYCERNFMGYVGFEGIYGKTVFLTREEAEAALKGGRD